MGLEPQTQSSTNGKTVEESRRGTEKEYLKSKAPENSYTHTLQGSVEVGWALFPRDCAVQTQWSTGKCHDDFSYQSHTEPGSNRTGNLMQKVEPEKSHH